MHPHAPNPAAQPHLFLNAFRVRSLSREQRNNGGERPSLKGPLASSSELRFGRTFAAEKRDDDFGPVDVWPFRIPSSTRGHASGPKPAPGGSALFCFDFVALWVTVSSYAEPSANAELGTWEPGPLARLRQV
jgi:hypothetical protein